MFERYTDMLYRLCYSILLQKEDAEDAVQDVFLIYFRKQPTFADEDHEKAWFIRVAVNRCRYMLRRRKVRAGIPLSEVEDTLADAGIDHEESAVLTGIYGLPEKYRVVMILHYLEEYPVKDVAKLLKITPSAVKMRLARGRDQLKASLGEEL